MKALIIVDLQNDFLPGGALPVPEGDQIVPVINHLKPKFKLVVSTQDWHPADHGSFASNHKHKKPGDTVLLNGLNQILWPDHCVQNSWGASFVSNLNISKIEKVFQKGTDADIDSYSGFFDNGHKRDTGMNDFLKGKGVDEIFVAGLAADYCVKYTALDGVRCGFKTNVILDATKAVNMHEDDFENAVEAMENAGVKMAYSKNII